MSYSLTDNAYIIRDQDGAHIPPDPGNRDYQAYLAWVAEGNEPAPIEPSPTPPIETPPPPDIGEVNAQVQEHDQRIGELESQMTALKGR